MHLCAPISSHIRVINCRVVYVSENEKTEQHRENLFGGLDSGKRAQIEVSRLQDHIYNCSQSYDKFIIHKHVRHVTRQLVYVIVKFFLLFVAQSGIYDIVSGRVL